MKTHLSQQKYPTLKNYEDIFASSENVVDFTNIISNSFPDYVRNKNLDTNVFSDRKTSNQNLNTNSDDGSLFIKELESQKSFLNSVKQTLNPYSNIDDIENDEKSLIKYEPSSIDSKPPKFNNFIKIEVVDALVDSIIISTLLPYASNQKKNSKFLHDTILEKKISTVSKEIVESEKVQKLAQKRIFLLSIGKLRPTPEEAERKKKMHFVSASKLNLKSILKNSVSQPNSNSNLIPNTRNQNQNLSLTIFSQSSKTNKPDLNNSNTRSTTKRVHFIPDKDDIIPPNAVVFDYKESAKIMKKAREEEKAIRKREEEFMKKVKTDFMTKQKTTKNKQSTTTNYSAFDFNIALKAKPKPRSKSAKTKAKPKVANLSSSLYPSYYTSKTKSSTTTHSSDKDDRIRKKTPIRSSSPQISFRSQHDENSNVIRRGKSSGLSEKPKTKPKLRQAKTKTKSGYEY